MRECVCVCVRACVRRLRDGEGGRERESESETSPRFGSPFAIWNTPVRDHYEQLLRQTLLYARLYSCHSVGATEFVFLRVFLHFKSSGLVLVRHDWYVMRARLVSALFGLVSAVFG
jgi:hypothetical protein